MHYLIAADRAWSPGFPRANPTAPWDWATLDEIDVFNDRVLMADADQNIAPRLFIEAGTHGLHVLGIDEGKDIQWVWGPNILGRFLNRDDASRP